MGNIEHCKSARRVRAIALAIALAIAVVAAASCASERSKAIDSGSQDRESQERQRDPSALIYAAVIRQLVSEDHGFGDAEAPYKVVYVLDGEVEGAEDPMRTLDRLQPDHPFDAGLKRQVIDQLSDLPPVRFVGDRGEVVVGARKGSSPGHVKNEGVLITLGPITESGAGEVTVGNNRWVNGLNGQWLTYTLNYRKGSWAVTGIAGNSMAIS